MKMVIQCNDYKTTIEPEGNVTMSEVYNGVRVKTEQGDFGVCERDGSIEVTRIDGPTQKGTLVYTSSIFAWKLPPPNNDQAVENPADALAAWIVYADKLEQRLAERKD
jgi:hypothetical protein